MGNKRLPDPIPDGLRDGGDIEAEDVCENVPIDRLCYLDEITPILGRTLFTLGQVYRYAHVNWDLASSFLRDQEISDDALQNFQYHRRVTFIKGWENVLQSFPVEVFEKFVGYIKGCCFVHKSTHEWTEVGVKQLWVPEHITPPGMPMTSPLTEILVFYTMSNIGRHIPYVCYEGGDGQPVIRFRNMPPEDRVKNTADAYFAEIT